MPGMMDTILNVGINDANIAGLADKHQNMEFALDSYRRLLADVWLRGPANTKAGV